jgi:putative DNA primase/helicase
VIELAKKTVWTIYQEAGAMESDPLRKWATRSHGSERLSAMVKMAKFDQQMCSEYKDFDTDPYLFTFTNGTVDLRTGAIRAHDPEDMISCLVPHTYSPYAQAPLWEKLISRCTQCDGSGQTAEYVLRVLGYMMIGNNIEQKLPLIIGEKRTGKSKIVEICARLLGPDYAVISQSKLVTKSQWSTHHDSETWSIRGKRLVAISETDAGMDLDEAMVKNLTGASTMAMRGLYRDKESQVPVTWTIIIATNEEPNVEKWDDAIGRRVIKIPSGPSLEMWEVDLDLEDKILQNEAEGVLASLVAGCTRWHQRRLANGTGLDMPQAVAQATRDFEEANNHVVEFIHACVNFGAGDSVPLALVNKAYKTHRGGKETLGRRALYERIMAYAAANGHQVTKDHRNFYGLRLAEQLA